jgi:Ca2+-transporting ATPase
VAKTGDGVNDAAALNDIFKTAPLSLGELALAIGISSLVFWRVEGERWLKRRC